MTEHITKIQTQIIEMEVEKTHIQGVQDPANFHSFT